MNLAGTSLIAAVPGGILFYILLMGFLGGTSTGSTSMPMSLKIAAIIAMLVSLIAVLFPPYFLVFFGRPRKKAAVAAGAAVGAGAPLEDLADSNFPEESPEDWDDSKNFGNDTSAFTGEDLGDDDTLENFTPEEDEGSFASTADFNVSAGEEAMETMEFEVEEVAEEEFNELSDDSLETNTSFDDDDFSFDDFDEDDNKKK